MDKLTRTLDEQVVNDKKKAAEETGADGVVVLEKKTDGSAELATPPDAEADDVLKEKPKYDSYDDFAEVADEHLADGYQLKGEIQALNEQRQRLLELSLLETDQKQVLDSLTEQYLVLSNKVAEKLRETDELLQTDFTGEDLKNYYPSLMAFKGIILRTIEKDESAITEHSNFTEETFLVEINESHEYLLQQKGALDVLYQNMLDHENDQMVFLDNSTTFDITYSKSIDIIDGLKHDFSILGGTFFNDDGEEIGNTVFQAFNKILLIAQKIENLTNKKNMLFLRKTNISNALSASSIEGSKEALDDAVTRGDITAVAAERNKQKLENILNFTSLSINELIDLNKGSSVDTFLSFLMDPVGTRGREGLSFGTTEIDGSQYEKVPLPLFRELFSDSKKVGKALFLSAKSIDESWADANSEDLRELEDFDKKTGPKKLKKLLLKMTKELFVDSGKRDENKQKFRILFTTSLMGDQGKDFYLDGKSMLFFIEQMQDDGVSLNNLWNISS